ncbi:MAG: ABC transporter permease [Nanobdellota archaeon]
MKRETIVYAVKNLLSRRLRSWLTVLSILIGIMAIFALVSFGVGVQNYVDTLSEDMGTDKLIIQPKAFTAPGESSISFDDSDLDAIERTRGINIAAPVITRNTEVKEDRDELGNWAYINGAPTTGEEQGLLKDTFMLDIEEGRDLRRNDKYKAVLGYNYKKEKEIFDRPLKLHQKVYIEGKGFRIVGFYDKLGNPQDDSNVYIPMDTAKEIFDTEDYDNIMAEASMKPEEVVDKVNRELRNERGLDEGDEDFYVQTFEDAVATFTNTINILNGVLILIALISVVVSAVNIANAMYTSVLERTREIGVMKAIGATRTNIQNMFLVESGLLGLAGGTIGIIAGYFVARAGGYYAAQAGYSLLQPTFPLWLIISCLAFSFIVGMISGYFPAKQASRMRPVDALRYE